jgi:hypothetical protein
METLWDTLGGAATGAASTLGGAASTLGGAASAVTAAVIDVTVVADGNNDDGDKDDTVGLLEIEGDDELELVRTYDLDDEDAFSLQTCEMLGEISILIYLEPPFWHSDMEKREDNFANGLAALCPTSRATLGVFTSSDGHALQGMTTPWDLSPLPPRFNCVWETEGGAGKGSITDGLINDTAHSTQAMITLRRGHKEIILAFRGTDSASDWRTNLSFVKVDALTGDFWIPGASGQGLGGWVHFGFRSAWYGIRNRVLGVCAKLLREKDPASGEPLFNRVSVAGHSLGGGLATFGKISFFYSCTPFFPTCVGLFFSFGSSLMNSCIFSLFLATVLAPQRPSTSPRAAPRSRWRP